MENIIRDLRTHSQAQFDRLNLARTSQVNTDFEALFESSAKRMTRENRTSDADLREAKKAFTTLIEKMDGYKQYRSGQRPLVQLQAFSQSKSSICPLWPIC